MRFFRRLNVRLFLSFLMVVVIGGLTVFLTTRLLAPTIFVDELEGLRLRQGQSESPGQGDGFGPGGTGGDGGGGGSGSTVGPGGGGGEGGSGNGPGGPGGAGGPGGQDGGANGPNAAGVLLQTDGPTEDEEIQEAFLDALDRALLIGLLVSLVIAVLLAATVSGRILRPIRTIRVAAGRLAGGHYDERIPLPSDPELSELAADFNELAATLQETEVRRMQLVSEVAHELRTPLTTIQGYMEGLIDGVLEPSEEVYASVADEAARLQRVASDLSVLSRIEEGAIRFEFEKVDLAAAAEKVANYLRQQYVDQDVALDVETDTPLSVSGDPDRLAQVFTNLIGNALGHTPAGGRVVVTSQQAGDLARVTVTDNGHGISPADLPRVFDRFYRAGQDPHSTGTGIGLTIARSIVRSHGGDVTAHSDGLGRGATFVVEIP
ncbi:MAG: HAMP domain-containing sensor histidine kinase, partial [Acidimicrobiia bacterium]|nr:HAMP domain-containing sensor histidine kinase [Acidimicrobiia bacterium]